MAVTLGTSPSAGEHARTCCGHPVPVDAFGPDLSELKAQWMAATSAAMTKDSTAMTGGRTAVTLGTGANRTRLCPASTCA
jgi:hypothetical protein